ncbi:MAG: hypothetical protein MUP16_02600 [Sedimentisphaerales bacterium]|nr:hypothetical protein [Sedimentisphaerales bacterium]
MNQALVNRTIGKSIIFICVVLLLQTSFLWAASTAGPATSKAAPEAKATPPSKPEDITGEWEMKMDFGGRESFATLSITKKADGTLTGKWGSDELSNVKFEGDKLTFVRTVRFGDQEFSMNYAGTLKDGKLTGTMSGERGDFAANGTRKKPKLPAVGQWDIKFNVGDREITARLMISQKQDGALEGKWTAEPGEHVLSNVKFENGKLTFTRKSKVNDMEFETTYEGAVKGDELAGMLKGDMGQFQANGKRFGTELVGKWELTSTSERGTRTSMMMIEPDLTGRYESFGGEIPMKDLKLEGDQVTFNIEFGPVDQTFKMEFKGKLDGKTLKGQMVSERGTSEITGKKLEGKVEEKKVEPAKK